MKANELRVGNLVSYHENISVVHGITDPDYGNGIHIHYEHTCIGCDEKLIEPIPLTEEWLFKFGFEKKPDMRYYSRNSQVNSWLLIKDDLVIQMYKNYNGVIDFRFNYPSADPSNFKSMGIRFVHQLQNLYFALTGEELTIKI